MLLEQPTLYGGDYTEGAHYVQNSEWEQQTFLTQLFWENLLFTLTYKVDSQ